MSLADNIDCVCGDVVAALNSPLEVADQFETTLIWLDEVSLVPGRSYFLKIGTQTLSASIAKPKYKLDKNSGDHLAATALEFNEIGCAIVTTERRISFAPYSVSPELGSFILIDKQSNNTVAAGMIRFALRRAQNIHWQAAKIGRDHHAAIKSQKPSVVWLTGLSGSGKSTIANILEQKLSVMGKHTFLLDGDNVRHGLCKDLGFTEVDRIENIRRVGEVAKLMSDAGLIVIVALISPFAAERDMVRKMVPAGEFLEVFVDTPLAIAEARDVKGLYAKARSGKLDNFTGIDSPYEEPTQPEFHIETVKQTAEDAANRILFVLTDGS